jgi:hypothetical protein
LHVHEQRLPVGAKRSAREFSAFVTGHNVVGEIEKLSFESREGRAALRQPLFINRAEILFGFQRARFVYVDPRGLTGCAFFFGR